MPSIRRRSSAAAATVLSSSAIPAEPPVYDTLDDVHSEDPPPPSYRSSVAPQPRVFTRSQGFGAAVAFERLYVSPTDSDLVFVTVRLRDEFRRASVDGGEDLPARPKSRSFLSRISTRISSTTSSSREPLRYKALKMPRGDFKRYFARDAQGNYIGTEPERCWNVDELMREYGEYQDLPLGAIQF